VQVLKTKNCHHSPALEAVPVRDAADLLTLVFATPRVARSKFSKWRIAAIETIKPARRVYFVAE
jgi:hypothetical protein